MKDLFWKYFTETGNIELYLEYKKQSRKREKERDGQRIKDQGADSAGGKQRRQ